MQRKLDEYKLKRRLEMRDLSKQLGVQLSSLELLNPKPKVSFEEKEENLRNTLRETYAKNVSNCKKDLEAHEGQSKHKMKERFEERRDIDESMLKDKKEVELNKIRISEQTRIEIEKSKTDKESLHSHNTSQILSNQLMDLKIRLEKEMKDEKKEIEDRVQRELDDYKFELQKKKAEVLNKLKGTKTQSKSNTIISTNKNAIIEKYEKDKADLEKEYERQLKSDNDDKVLSEILSKEEKTYKDKLHEDLIQEELVHDKKVQRELKRLEQEITNIRAKQKTITQEIISLQNETDTLEGLEDQKNAQLLTFQKHLNILKTEYNNLNTTLNNFTNTVKVDKEDAFILKAELEEKDNEILKLLSLHEKPLVEHKEDLSKLVNDVREVKTMILKERRTKTVKRQRKRKDYQLNDLTLQDTEQPIHIHKQKKLTEAEIAYSKAKLKEITLFVASEKLELKSTKEQVKSSYDMILQLLKRIEEKRREWRQDFYNCKGDRKRKAVLGTIKDDFDEKAQSLAKQARELQSQLILIEKKTAILNTLETKMEQPLILQREYEGYLRKYKYAEHKQREVTDQELITEIEVTLPPHVVRMEQNFMEPSKKSVNVKPMRVSDSIAFVDEANWLYQVKNEITKGRYNARLFNF